MEKGKKMEKVKKIAKYGVNIINFVNAILVVLIPIWNIPYGHEISASLVGISGVISTYLIGQKVVSYYTEGE